MTAKVQARLDKHAAKVQAHEELEKQRQSSAAFLKLLKGEGKKNSKGVYLNVGSEQKNQALSPIRSPMRDIVQNTLSPMPSPFRESNKNNIREKSVIKIILEEAKEDKVIKENNEVLKRLFKTAKSNTKASLKKLSNEVDKENAQNEADEFAIETTTHAQQEQQHLLRETTKTNEDSSIQNMVESEQVLKNINSTSKASGKSVQSLTPMRLAINKEQTARQKLIEAATPRRRIRTAYERGIVPESNECEIEQMIKKKKTSLSPMPMRSSQVPPTGSPRAMHPRMKKHEDVKKQKESTNAFLQLLKTPTKKQKERALKPECNDCPTNELFKSQKSSKETEASRESMTPVRAKGATQTPKTQSLCKSSQKPFAQSIPEDLSDQISGLADRDAVNLIKFPIGEQGVEKVLFTPTGTPRRVGAMTTPRCRPQSTTEYLLNESYRNFTCGKIGMNSSKDEVDDNHNVTITTLRKQVKSLEFSAAKANVESHLAKDLTSRSMQSEMQEKDEYIDGLVVKITELEEALKAVDEEKKTLASMSDFRIKTLKRQLAAQTKSIDSLTQENTDAKNTILQIQQQNGEPNSLDIQGGSSPSSTDLTTCQAVSFSPMTRGSSQQHLKAGRISPMGAKSPIIRVRLDKEMQEKDQMITKLQNDIQKLQSDRDSLSSQVAALLRTNTVPETPVEPTSSFELDSKVTSPTTKLIYDLLISRKELEDALGACERSMQRADDQNNEEKLISAEELVASQELVKSLTIELQESRKLLKTAQLQVEPFTGDFDSLQNTSIEESSALTALLNGREFLNGQLLSEARREAEESKLKVSAIEDRVKGTVSETTSYIACLEGNIEELKNEQVQLKQDKKDLENQIEQRSQALSNLREVNGRVEDDKAALEIAVTAKDKENATLRKSINSKLAAANTENAVLRCLALDVVDKSKVTVQTLEIMHADETSQQAVTLKSLQEKLDLAGKEISHLQYATLSLIEKSSSTISSLEEMQQEEINEKLQEANKEVSNLQYQFLQMIERSEDTIHRLEEIHNEEILELEGKRDYLIKQLTVTQQSNDDLQKTLLNTLDKASSTTLELQAMHDEEMGELKSKYNELQDQFDIVTKDNDFLRGFTMHHVTKFANAFQTYQENEATTHAGVLALAEKCNHLQNNLHDTEVVIASLCKEIKPSADDKVTGTIKSLLLIKEPAAENREINRKQAQLQQHSAWGTACIVRLAYKQKVLIKDLSNQLQRKEQELNQNAELCSSLQLKVDTTQRVVQKQAQKLVQLQQKNIETAYAVCQTNSNSTVITGGNDQKDKEIVKLRDQLNAAQRVISFLASYERWVMKVQQYHKKFLITWIQENI